MQLALDVRSSVAPAVARPVLVARNGEQVPVRPVAPVSPLKRIVGQDDSRFRTEAPQPDEALHNDTRSESVATVGGPGAAPVASSLFLAQHIAQEGYGENRPSKAENEASVAAYRGAAERGTVFFGLQYPVDFTV